MPKKIPTNSSQVPEAIAERVAFVTGGTLRAIDSGFRRIPLGDLATDERAALEAVLDTVDYVVYSGETPIAWHSAEGWHYVEQEFSLPGIRAHRAKLPALDDEG